MIAVLVLGLVGTLGYFVLKVPHVSVTTGAQPCANAPAKLASLFSDDETTMIRLSNPDFTGMQILRTEPANVLPGMFDALLALSGDSSRLAYVTASDELMNKAAIEYIDVANPAVRIDLATVASGFWVIRPAWSPDHRKLAWVELDQSGGPPGQFGLWVADTAVQPAVVGLQADLVADNFTNGHSATICWTADNRVILIPSTPTPLPSPSPTAQAASPSPSTGPATGAPCGVPIFSQNDPAWRAAVMQAGADSIGAKGCALTTAAMLLNYYGSTLTPADLNTCLGNNADPVAWTSVPPCTKNLIKGGDRINFTWTDLDALLASGRPAIVGMLRGLTGSHFVVVTSGGGGVASNYRITDPWDATTYKTLASYTTAGYNPEWIISYSGPGHNCARLITGAVSPITTVSDGGSTKGPVTINIAPNIKNLQSIEILKLSNGIIPTNIFNQPLPFTKIAPGTTITDEGIYQLLVITKAPSPGPHVQFVKFTIDKTPPSINLALLNLLKPASGTFDGQLTRGMAAGSSTPGLAPRSSYPLIDKPGKIQIQSSDSLSGVANVQYSLDGAGFVQYSSDTSFNAVILVPQSGDHSLIMKATDAAGNVKQLTSYFTVFGYIPPSPSPTPPPTAPPCHGFKLIAFHAGPHNANYAVPLDWGTTGACGTVTGTITATSSGSLPPTKVFPISGPAGSLTDTMDCVPGVAPPHTETYTIVLTDSAGQTFAPYSQAVSC